MGCSYVGVCDRGDTFYWVADSGMSNHIKVILIIMTLLAFTAGYLSAPTNTVLYTEEEKRCEEVGGELKESIWGKHSIMYEWEYACIKSPQILYTIN